MKRIQRDSDWFYEFRPYILIVLGFLGVFNRLIAGQYPVLIPFGQLCGAVVLFAAYKIIIWRQEYRKNLL